MHDSSFPNTDEFNVHRDMTERWLPSHSQLLLETAGSRTRLFLGKELPVMVFIICMKVVAYRVTHRPDCYGEHKKKKQTTTQNRQAVKIALDMQTISLLVMVTAPCSGCNGTTPRIKLHPV